MVYDQSQMKTKPIPVRLEKEVGPRLKAAALSMGSTVSGVIRLAILTKLPEIENAVKSLKEVKQS